MASIFLHGLSIANFRGVGPIEQQIAPFREINFVVGPNNAGKSTVLLFLSKYLHPVQSSSHTGWQRSFDSLDLNLNNGTAEVKYGFAIPKSSIVEKAVAAVGVGQRDNIVSLLDGFSNDELIWLYPERHLLEFSPIEPNVRKALLDHEAWQSLWRGLTQKGGGDMTLTGYLKRLGASRTLPRQVFRK